MKKTFKAAAVTLVCVLVAVLLCACGKETQPESAAAPSDMENTSWTLTQMTSGDTVYTSEQLSGSGITGSLKFSADEFFLELTGSTNYGAYDLDGSKLTLKSGESSVEAEVTAENLTLDMSGAVLEFSNSGAVRCVKTGELDGTKWTLVATQDSEYGTYDAEALADFGISGELKFADGKVTAYSGETVTSEGTYTVVDDHRITMFVVDGELNAYVYADTIVMEYEEDTMTYALSAE